MITLLTMAQGNPIALQRTLDSFKPYVNEVIFGDVLLFADDRDKITSMAPQYNMKIVRFDFNYIFQNGFAAILNAMASHATNDHVIYMNVSEVIDIIPGGELFTIPSLYNAYFFDHPTEKHKWYRQYNRTQVEWTGLIHEEVRALPGFELKRCPVASFRMVDTEKDMEDSFKAKVYNDCKELVYFSQYLRLIDEPHMQGQTHPYWIEYAKDSYVSLKDRLTKKGNRYEAFKSGNLELYMQDIYENPEFENERFESSKLINYQGSRSDVL